MRMRLVVVPATDAPRSVTLSQTKVCSSASGSAERLLTPSWRESEVSAVHVEYDEPSLVEYSTCTAVAVVLESDSSLYVMTMGAPTVLAAAGAVMAMALMSDGVIPLVLEADVLP